MACCMGPTPRIFQHRPSIGVEDGGGCWSNILLCVLYACICAGQGDIIPEAGPHTQHGAQHAAGGGWRMGETLLTPSML